MKRRTCCLIVVCLLVASGVSQGTSMVGTANIYFGHLHNHTGLSDGSGTPAQAYSTARTAGLDFFGLADHGEQLSADDITAMITAADAANDPATAENDPDAFSTFYGFEWSSGAYGHITVVNPLTFTSTTETPTFSGFMSWLDTNGGVAFFNHPGTHGVLLNEFEHFIGASSGKIVGMELWNKDSFLYYNSGFTSDSRDRSGYYDEALLNHWYIGAGGSQDHHGTTWGSGSYRLAVLSGSNTRDAIYNALSSRCFYSTLDKNLELSFQVNGSQMGSGTAGGRSICVVKAADRDGEGFTNAEIIQNGYIKWSGPLSGTPATATCELFTQQGDYIYCTVSRGSIVAISSPVFITSNGPDGAPRADLAVPLDNGPDDLESANDKVTVNTTQSDFQIQLTDFDGVVDGTVTSDKVTVAGQTLDEPPQPLEVAYSFAYVDGADVITLTPASGSFGNGIYTITVSGISDNAGYTMQLPAILTVEIDTSIVAPETVHFQNSVDTMIRSAAAGASYPINAIITADTSDESGGVSQVLLRFDDIIGTAGQIPPGAIINSATLRLRSLDTGGGGSLYAMLRAWSDTSTWNSLINGVQPGVDASSAPDDGITANSPGDVDLDVTGTVQSWADGTMANNGWAVLAGTSDGWDIASAEHGTADYHPELIVTFVPGSPIHTAHNPSPVNGASGLPVGIQLQWSPGSGAVAHDVYFGQGSTPVLVSAGQAGTTYTPQLLEGGKTYSWRIDEYTTYPGVPVEGQVWTFETAPTTAVSESAVKGAVTGSYLDTRVSDNTYETIQEVESNTNKNGYSTLEHVWQFSVPAGTYAEFTVEASRVTDTDGDNFDFSYSTDNATYQYMLTVADSTDTEQSYVLPAGTAGTVYIKATDTNHVRGAKGVATLYVNFMQIVSSRIPIPQAPKPPVANAGPDQTVTAAGTPGSANVTLDGSGSYDPDGSIASYDWYVGDVKIASGVQPMHVFGTGSHTVTLVVTDDDDMTGSDEVIITVQAAGTSMHVADLDGMASGKGGSSQWAALVTVTIVDQAEIPVAGATVTGAWSVGGIGTGVTDSTGKIMLMSPTVKGSSSVTFTVTNVTHSTLTYNSADNTDPDIPPDSSGTQITVTR